jgi:hypothetical protein
MSQFDPVRGCLAAPAPVAGVCSTSVNRCGASAGIGVECAFGPDGSVFVAVLSDNYVLTAKGWHFVQAAYLVGTPDSDEVATSAEEMRCYEVNCAPPCPGVKPLEYFRCDGGSAGSDAHAE